MLSSLKKVNGKFQERVKLKIVKAIDRILKIKSKSAINELDSKWKKTFCWVCIKYQFMVK